MVDILIVEDEMDIRESLKDILEAENYSICTAANGLEALALLQNAAAPKLILLDFLMPLMNGLEFREQQAHLPHLAKIPVILMSADKYIQTKAEQIDVKYVKKPIDLETLLSTIKGYF